LNVDDRSKAGCTVIPERMFRLHPGCDDVKRLMW
jgi:hypothetical protein